MFPTFDQCQPITSQDNRHTGWLVTVADDTDHAFVVTDDTDPRPR